MLAQRRRSSRRFAPLLALMFAALLATLTPSAEAAGNQAGSSDRGPYFELVGDFPIRENLDDGEDPATRTSAGAMAVTDDGGTLIYTDSAAGRIGFVDIGDPADPRADGFVTLDGEPTSVAVHRQWILVTVDTSQSFVKPSGRLIVLDADDHSLTAAFELPGQPEALATNRASRFGAIVIENERDPDVIAGGAEGGLPQAPPGSLIRLTMAGDPTDWSLDRISLSGLAEVAALDPEPESVDINAIGHAVVTLQENNHLVVINLNTGETISHFSAGTTDLDLIDTATEDPGVIEPNGSLGAVRREPDGVTWISNREFVTANEGDLVGGSRGFTVYNVGDGELFDAGNTFDHLAIAVGHYPEHRSGSRGSRPEGAEFARYQAGRFLFVASEGGNFVAVYRLDGSALRLHQVLPTGVGPEGVLTIADRDLLVVSSEVDDEDNGVRSLIGLYQLTDASRPSYPGLSSESENGDAPIGWGALSSLVADPTRNSRLHAIHNDAYGRPRIYTIATSGGRGTIVDELILDLGNDLDPGNDLALDAEGLAVDADGNFWIASEGAGTAGEIGAVPNRLVHVEAASGKIVRVVELPPEVAANQRGAGFGGVAFDRGRLYVVFQREWADDPEGRVKIARFDPADDSWAFAHYRLDKPESPAGGWVGLSEIRTVGDGVFAVIERDNQRGAEKRVARLTTVSLGDEVFGSAAAPGTVVKSEHFDLLAMLDRQSQSGQWGAKIDGLAVDRADRVWYVTNNDGLVNASGETLFGTLGSVSDLPGLPSRSDPGPPNPPPPTGPPPRLVPPAPPAGAEPTASTEPPSLGGPAATSESLPSAEASALTEPRSPNDESSSTASLSPGEPPLPSELPAPTEGPRSTGPPTPSGPLTAAEQPALIDPDPLAPPTAEGPGFIGDHVSFAGDDPAPAIVVDLFSADPLGLRASYLRSTATDDAGTYRFEVEPDCYVVVAIAPADQLFLNGSQWNEQGACVVGAEVDDTVDSVLTSGEEPAPGDTTGDSATAPTNTAPSEEPVAEKAVVVNSAIGSSVTNQDGSPAAGVSVDLFGADTAGARTGYLRSTATGGSGAYSFQVAAGCYVVVFIAPDGRTFANGSAWSEHFLCLQAGESRRSINAVLAA